MRLLDEAEFKATVSDGMAEVAPEDAPQISLRSYVDSIPPEDLQGHDFSQRDVETVRRAPRQRWVHVLLKAPAPNVFLVLVVDSDGLSVHGHHLLDLSRQYGLGNDTT